MTLETKVKVKYMSNNDVFYVSADNCNGPPKTTLILFEFSKTCC